MRFAYADPPYIGCANRYPEKQEVDHEALIRQIENGGYDGWALSCHTPSLRYLLPLCPEDTRVMAWVKPFAVFRPNVNPAYAWEPVLVRGGRKRARGALTVRDWVSVGITMRRFLPDGSPGIGAKPDAFCFWLFEVFGMEDGDEFIDLYPGTGAVTRAWEAWRNRPRQALLIAE